MQFCYQKGGRAASFLSFAVKCAHRHTFLQNYLKLLKISNICAILKKEQVFGMEAPRCLREYRKGCHCMRNCRSSQMLLSTMWHALQAELTGKVTETGWGTAVNMGYATAFPLTADVSRS